MDFSDRKRQAQTFRPFPIIVSCWRRVVVKIIGIFEHLKSVCFMGFFQLVQIVEQQNPREIRAQTVEIQEKMDRLQEQMQDLRIKLEHTKGKTERSCRSLSSQSSSSWIPVKLQAEEEIPAPAIKSTAKTMQEKKTAPPKEGPELEEMCFCGKKVKEYVSRVQGPNFLRKFLRCPQPQESQCEYFQWTEPRKQLDLHFAQVK